MHACDALPAEGTWELITPPYDPPPSNWADGFSLAIEIDPRDTRVVYVGIGNRGLWRTADCGATWTHVNEGTNGATIDSGNFWSIVLDPVSPDTIYAVNGYGAQGMWRSDDGGSNWTDTLPPGTTGGDAVGDNFFTGVSIDPTDSRHLVLTPHANCNAPHHSGCHLETYDRGETWTVVPGPTNGWEEGSGPVVLGPHAWLFAAPFNGLWLTEDSGANWRNVAPANANGSSGGGRGIVYASDGHYYLPTLWGVIRSTDGRSWSYVEGSNGRWVGIAGGQDALFVSDQWSNTYRRASLSDLATWTEIPPPPGLRADMGASHIAYDPDHHILYSSSGEGGLWRLVIE